MYYQNAEIVTNDLSNYNFIDFLKLQKTSLQVGKSIKFLSPTSSYQLHRVNTEQKTVMHPHDQSCPNEVMTKVLSKRATQSDFRFNIIHVRDIPGASGTFCSLRHGLGSMKLKHI